MSENSGFAKCVFRVPGEVFVSVDGVEFVSVGLAGKIDILGGLNRRGEPSCYTAKPRRTALADAIRLMEWGTDARH
ncbi:MAG: hypothetical protein ABGX82_14535 [Pseudomonas sp.]|uniref:hypothetical protein n=1 Tax=Pseudomonas sp. TaxID=306 RepID=UPI0032429D72